MSEHAVQTTGPGPVPDYLTVLTSDLLFPERPVALPNGDVLFTEIGRGTVSRLTAAGVYEVVAETGHRPAGLAMGPDGKIYICQDGGINYAEVEALRAQGYRSPLTVEPGGGSIQRLDLATGALETLYTEASGWPIGAANDIVFDEWGGFYFTDYCKQSKRMMTRGRVCYGRPDGSAAYDVVAPIDSANGVGLSPDGRTLYVAQAAHGRLWAFDVTGPGQVKVDKAERYLGGRLICSLPVAAGFDSLGVDAEGYVCVATTRSGHITVVAPDRSGWTQVDVGDHGVTNICWGGADLKTAYITLSGYGQLASMTWERGGAPLHFLNR